MSKIQIENDKKEVVMELDLREDVETVSFDSTTEAFNFINNAIASRRYVLSHVTEDDGVKVKVTKETVDFYEPN